MRRWGRFGSGSCGAAAGRGSEQPRATGPGAQRNGGPLLGPQGAQPDHGSGGPL